MYDELYDAWFKEKESAKLQKLPKEFYIKIAEYIGKIRREGRMLDTTSAKAKLISQELSNVKRLMEELVQLRFKKIVFHATSAKPVEREVLTSEEEKTLSEITPSLENLQSFLKKSLRGKISRVEEKTDLSKRILLRFLKETPAVVGSDLKIYGPFSAEDVATLPVENAKVLLKHGVVMEIETK